MTRLLFAMLAVTLLAARFVRSDIVLDQEQTLYNADETDPSLPNYQVGESFTPGVSGTLAQISMAFGSAYANKPLDGDGTLQVYFGEGNAGPLLYTTTVSVHADANVKMVWNDFPVDVPNLTAGDKYTFLFQPDPATMPNTYGLDAGTGDPYPRGEEIDVVSGQVIFDPFQGIDLDFKTYVFVPEPSVISPLAGVPLLLWRRRTLPA